MRLFIGLLGVSYVFGGGLALARDYSMEEVVLSPPDGWTLTQEAKTKDTIFSSFTHGTEIFSFYVKAATKMDMKAIFVNGAQVLAGPKSELHGPFNWQLLDTSKTSQRLEGTSPYYVAAFLTEWNGRTYYGYARTASQQASEKVTLSFLDNLKVRVRGAGANRSLTGPDYKGKKYYFGFGDELGGSMGNEVKYDIKHTNDIFTALIGGSYLGFTKLSPGHDGIVQHWQDLKGQMTPNDMYIQYSSGHGSEGMDGGLMAGVSWDEIATNTLALPAKEIIVFTMACFSGNMVKQVEARKSQWQDWPSQGRTLYVMGSSQPGEESSTGPGTDPDEPNGPDGSAGSAFGHALWKSLIGYADGYEDGVKDGFLSLEEIRDYTIMLTKQIANQQTPTVGGAYQGSLIMNQVPPKALVAALEAEGGTAGLSDAEIMEKVRLLDQQMSVR